MDQLSPNFTLQEMTVSQTAIRRAINNTPNKEAIDNLRELCENVLEPVRAHFGKPVIVTSGYRSPKLNKRIGGSRTSDHCKGAAADIRINGVSSYDIAMFIADNCQFKQVIQEFSSWCHVSYLSGNNKCQRLTAKRVNNRTRYINGIIR